jgi:glycosyltransferase involved in cell wall biosynthesis
MRSADAFVAVSRHAATEAGRILGLDTSRIQVVPSGVGEAFRAPLRRKRADPPYLLYVSEWGPSKGYPEAFAVIATLADAGYPHRLKVVGRLAEWHRAHVEDALNRAGRRDRVDLLGYVAEPELIRLYQGASAVVVTSRAEGFCFPAAEAMATGAAVVAFSNTAITETVGSGGILVRDGDVEAMAEAVGQLVGDPAAQRMWSERALQRAVAFDWDKTAELYAAILRAV